MQFGIAEAVDHWAKYRPSSIAAHAGTIPWTYERLNTLGATIAAQVETGAGDQTRIAIAVGSRVTMLAAILGVLRSGRSVVLLNTGLPMDTIRVNLEDASVKALLYDEDQAHLAKLVPSSVAIPAQPHLVSLPSPVKERHSNDEWGVLFSSGTTGVPKGIERDHESMVIELVGWCLELGLTRHSKFYIGRPIYYTGGLVLTLATLLVGGTAILSDDQCDDSFDAIWADYQRALEGIGIDFAFFIPDQFRQFLSIAGAQPRTARTVLTMGGPITGAEKQQIVEAFGCDIIESWGNSESLGTITDPEDVHARPDSIGRPFLTDEMSVLDDNDQPVQPLALGRLAGSESAGFRQYCNRPKQTALAKRNSLIISEDLGYVDGDGFYYIRGRSQDCLVLPDGSNIFLQELERDVRSLPMIQDCYVFTTTSGGTEVRFHVAVALTTPQADGDFADAIGQKLKSKIAAPQIRVFDALPRLPSGKLDRLAVQRDFAHTN